jgi:hypothetical protein
MLLAEKGRKPACGHRRQHGQALVEVVLSMLLVLIPTFIFIWILSAHGQARTAAFHGARYAAWERTVWRESPVKKVGTAVRSSSEIEKLMIERIFVPDRAIQSNVESPATHADLPSFYTVHHGGRLVDIERKPGEAHAGEAARPTLKLYESGESTSTVSQLYNGFAGVMSHLGAEKMELEEKGLYIAEVNLKLNAVQRVKVFDSLNLDLTQRAAVVTDAWNASGKKHEEAIVQPMVPFAVLQSLTDLLNIEILQDFTPFANFKPGCVRGDLLPTAMLPPGTAQATGVCK